MIRLLAFLALLVIAAAQDVCLRQTTDVSIPTSFPPRTTKEANDMEECVHICLQDGSCKALLYLNTKCMIYNIKLANELQPGAAGSVYGEIIPCSTDGAPPGAQTTTTTPSTTTRKQIPQRVTSSPATLPPTTTTTTTTTKKPTPPAVITVIKRTVCKDFDAECGDFAWRGECSINPVWMIPNCRRACGICEAVSSVTGQESNCFDADAECAKFARDGECQLNPDWMLVNCRHSCGLCSGTNVRRSGSSGGTSSVISNGGYATWSSWSPQSCPNTCSYPVTQERSRQCRAYGNNCYGQPQEKRTCECPSSWGQWGPWNACSLTCAGGGYGGGGSNSVFQSRSRTCQGYRGCQGDSQQKQPCQLPPCAQWGNWGPWSQSTITCVPANSYGTPNSGGTCDRTRSCKPANGNCVGDARQQQPCAHKPPQCAEWNNWGPWSQSTVTCVPANSYGTPNSGGVCDRSRTCKPLGGNCQGVPRQERSCQYKPPQCAQWNTWGPWSESSITCVPTNSYGTPNSGGTCSRTRTCSPTGGNCIGDGRQQQPCSYKPPQCAEWNNWGPWSQSTITCVPTKSYGTPNSAGTCFRSRTCKPPGGNCVGDGNQQRPCDSQPPPCAEWGPWGSWSESTVTCVNQKSYGQQGSGGTCSRTRPCDPLGANCIGDSRQSQPCGYKPPQCASWNNWGPWSQSTITCVPAKTYGTPLSTGVCSRNRDCSPPGGNCIGQSSQSEPCRGNPPPCPEWSGWVNWSQCSVSCGIGQRSRQRSCSPGGSCQGPAFEQNPCNDGPCDSGGTYYTGNEQFYKDRHGPGR